MERDKSHIAPFIGLICNARKLTVGMADKYMEELHCLLRNTSHKGRKQSFVKRLAELLR
jgi:hypothetical protein